VNFSRPKSLKDTSTHYCPGCGHGIIHRLIAEVVDELGIREKTVGVAPVGCAAVAYYYFNFDMCEAAHGRAPAVATGIKRVIPQSIVFSYQGDGDLVAIGTAEIIHAAARGERITTIFVNNGTYGMTGGQMAPTTILGQVTKTTPKGREGKRDGYPIRVCELLAGLEGVVYLERTSVHSPKEIKRTKNAIKKAFLVQLNDLGFSLVEILSMCPVNWGLTPTQSIKWIEERMIPYFKIKEFKKPYGL
jgi:2-oxoglutarate ferredoxin oxidoreductase subunit beta